MLLRGGSSLAQSEPMKTSTESIVLGAGCFWCIEAIFQTFRGIEKVESGYAGGKRPNPTYEQVSSGATGHAEVVRVTFDPKILSLSQLLEIFFHAHDPTTLNRQGADEGTQYRSAIFYSSPEQLKIAEDVRDRVTLAKVWGNSPLVTEIAPLQEFYPAEDYHQNYYQSNPNRGYCSIVIAPKVQKIRKEFASLLK